MQFTTLTVVLLTLFLVQQDTHAHVVLTYPPARYPQYDYLDNYRNGGPCGVPGIATTNLVDANITHSSDT